MIWRSGDRVRGEISQFGGRSAAGEILVKPLQNEIWAQVVAGKQEIKRPDVAGLPLGFAKLDIEYLLRSTVDGKEIKVQGTSRHRAGFFLLGSEPRENVPQGLKPTILAGLRGTAEAVPLQSPAQTEYFDG